ncbi:hypothetical protein [Actinokineospora enzanensis]|uniref:hypothetical protein n=1 Tax=Actinokineospora enzanensis TaxID=155975 RepID=UPI00036510C9|nr:hypothetical protein [Actinokineospora enzanensis]
MIENLLGSAQGLVPPDNGYCVIANRAAIEPQLFHFACHETVVSTRTGCAALNDHP